MKFIIVGASGAGKEFLAEDIAKKLGISTNTGMKLPEDNDYLLGMLADYRVELMLASNRAFAAVSKDEAAHDVIYTHSLIDSATYAAMRIIEVVELEGSQDAYDRWALTSGITSTLLKDSFRYDVIFFLCGGEPKMEKALREVLEALELPHTLLESSQSNNLIECHRVIEEWIAKK